MLAPNHPSPTASISQIEGPVGPELRSAAAHGMMGDRLLLSLVARPPWTKHYIPSVSHSFPSQPCYWTIDNLWLQHSGITDRKNRCSGLGFASFLSAAYYFIKITSSLYRFTCNHCTGGFQSFEIKRPVLILDLILGLQGSTDKPPPFSVTAARPPQRAHPH